jgi:predicted Zn-dependent protease
MRPMGPMGCWMGLALLLTALPVQSAEPCTRLRQGELLALNPLLRPAGETPADPPDDYRHRLQTTAMGWPVQSLWCVWVEPAETDSPASATSQRWLVAIARALQEWQQVLPIREVQDPQRAQVRVWRRRPPLRQDSMGRARASHGRAILSLRALGTGPDQTAEPQVEVLISPGQRLEAIQATALHELGHAFGLWGHSEDPGDAMAISPGSRPILQLSERDRATVRWLYRHAKPMGSGP